jgi:simple sugar transport system ATP-binding protein
MLRGRLVADADPATVTPEQLGSAMTGAAQGPELDGSQGGSTSSTAAGPPTGPAAGTTTGTATGSPAGAA